MRLQIHENGYGYTREGVRYWRNADGHWLRVIASSAAVSFTAYRVRSGTRWPSSVMLRLKGENVVYEVGS